jgi:hypothetical protein
MKRLVIVGTPGTYSPMTWPAQWWTSLFRKRKKRRSLVFENRDILAMVNSAETHDLP